MNDAPFQWQPVAIWAGIILACVLGISSLRQSAKLAHQSDALAERQQSLATATGNQFAQVAGQMETLNRALVVLNTTVISLTNKPAPVAISASATNVVSVAAKAAKHPKKAAK